MILEQLMIDADGFCAATHAVVQLCPEVQPGYCPILWMLLHCCKGFLEFLETEQAVCLRVERRRFGNHCPHKPLRAAQVTASMHLSTCRNKLLRHNESRHLRGMLPAFSKVNSLKSTACPSMCSTASSKRESSMSMTALQATASFAPGSAFRTAASDVILSL